MLRLSRHWWEDVSYVSEGECLFLSHLIQSTFMVSSIVAMECLTCSILTRDKGSSYNGQRGQNDLRQVYNFWGPQFLHLNNEGVELNDFKDPFQL